MRDPDEIRRVTHGVAMMQDPPFLPMALWFAIVPLGQELDLIAPMWGLTSMVLAFVATLIGVRWFKRTFGVVAPEDRSFAGYVKGGLGAVVVVVVLALELAAGVAGLPFRLGIAVFGLFLGWGAYSSRSMRPHLYVLAAICFGVACLPLVTGRFADGRSVFSTAFGLGWVVACVQDYRVLRRHLPQVQA